MRQPFVHEKVKEAIIDKIEAGELKAGDRILSQNQLSEKYGLSVESVRKALKSLRGEGYIRTEVGRGSFVLPPDSRGGGSDSRLLGLIIADLSHSFHADIARACEDKITKEGYHLVFGNSDNDSKKEKLYMEQFCERGIDGAIVVTGPGSYENDFIEEFTRRVPTTFIDCELEGMDADLVKTDDVTGSYEAVSRLISMGHRKIAYIGYPRHISTSNERFLGYKKALSENYIKDDDSLVYEVVLSREARYEGARKFLEEHGDATAVFVSEDRIAASVLYVARQKSLEVPENLSIVGYGDLQLDTDVTLTTVRQPAYQMGETAAKLLLERIKKSDGPRQKVVLPVELVERDSTGPCASGNEIFQEAEEELSMKEVCL